MAFLKNFFQPSSTTRREAGSVPSSALPHFEFRERVACVHGCDCAAAGGYETCCLPCDLSAGARHSGRCPCVQRAHACRTCSGKASVGNETCCKFCPERHSHRCPYRHRTLQPAPPAPPPGLATSATSAQRPAAISTQAPMMHGVAQSMPVCVGIGNGPPTGAAHIVHGYPQNDPHMWNPTWNPSAHHVPCYPPATHADRAFELEEF